METEMRSFLLTIPRVGMPNREPLTKLLKATILVQEEPVATLQAQFLTVGEDSCYGQMSIFAMSMNNPTKEDWELSEQLGGDFMGRGLCSSVMLRQGCKSKGFFGAGFTSAIIAAPDFAKLAALKYLGKMNVSGLPDTVEKLHSLPEHERYCEIKWKALVAECKADPRFALVSR